MDALERAAYKKRIADNILADLDLIARWQRFGRPVLVGAYAYDLIVEPDIDIEIYCPDLRIEHGFQVLCECVLNRAVTHASFSNELNGRDKALYWQLRYRQNSVVEWKIDMWSAPADYALPRSEDLIEPMRRALTPETRRIILELKEARWLHRDLACPSVDLYRAVLEDGVRTLDDLRHWLQSHTTGQLLDWKPAVSPTWSSA